ncbi:MAG: hypothetical protein EOP02_23630, partial [Proteobacteria bacterium]
VCLPALAVAQETASSSSKVGIDPVTGKLRPLTDAESAALDQQAASVSGRSLPVTGSIPTLELLLAVSCATAKAGRQTTHNTPDSIHPGFRKLIIVGVSLSPAGKRDAVQTPASGESFRFGLFMTES